MKKVLVAIAVLALVSCEKSEVSPEVQKQSTVVIRVDAVHLDEQVIQSDLVVVR